MTKKAAPTPPLAHRPPPAAQPPRPAGRGLRQPGLLVIDATIVAVGTTVGLLLPVNPWLAVPVGLAAYLCLYLAAVRVLPCMRYRETR
jgi:hypothetical protein